MGVSAPAPVSRPGKGKTPSPIRQKLEFRIQGFRFCDKGLAIRGEALFPPRGALIRGEASE